MPPPETNVAGSATRRTRLGPAGEIVIDELGPAPPILGVAYHRREPLTVSVRLFGASAEVGAKFRYLLFAEFTKAPSDLDAFARAFDEGLQAVNRVYREHRVGEVALLPPRVIPLRPGGAKAYLSETTRGNVQGKFPRIIDPSKKASVMAYAQAKPLD